MRTDVVEYSDGPVTLRGYLAYDEREQTPRPGIIVVHDAFGLNHYPKMRAQMLAELGYVAFAADLYGDGATAENQTEVLALYEPIAKDTAKQRRRLHAALERLRSAPQVMRENISVIGYCLGGGAALELARSGADVRGVVSFHGALDTDKPADPGQIKGKVLVCHGADDPLIPPVDVATFEDEMRRAKADWQVNIYGNALHAFTIEWIDALNAPIVKYDRTADQRSWSAMREFLAEVSSDRVLSD
jgi:dienelactone hydrolase